VHTKAPEDGGTKCHLLRDWLWWQARSYFRDNNPVIQDPSTEMRTMIKELAQPSFKYVSGKIKVSSKDDLRKDYGASPDLADALVLTFYADWQAKLDKKKKKKRKKHGHKESTTTERWKVI